MTVQDAKHRPEDADKQRHEGENPRHLIVHLLLGSNYVPDRNENYLQLSCIDT
jgi:hypothetical protein